MAGNRLTKSQFVQAVADKSGLNRKQAASALEAVSDVVKTQLKEGGEVTIPGLIKLTVATKPAVPARQGINPFTKEPTTFKAKPERKVVKARPIKALKDEV
jgi:DNA-binding protein HU-beta